MKKVLVIGPSPNKSKGGMSTVIEEIKDDKNLNEQFDIEIYESYIDGSKVKVYLYTVYAFLKFVIIKRHYDVYHIHVASRGSTFRKMLYVKMIKRWNKKVILHIHGAEYLVFFDEINKKNKLRVINMLNSADLVIALSEEWKKKFYNIFGISNCVVIENGINIDKLEEGHCELNDFRGNLVCLGKIGHRKGSYDLIKAISMAKKQIPNLKLFLAGDGEITEIKKEIERLNLKDNIEVVGWADFKRKIDILKKSSILVLPSYNEGLPMAILEGMACGKAIISTTVGAIPEVVGNENGILTKPGDINALASAIVELSINETLLKKMGKANEIKIEENFSMKVMHNKIAKYYLEV